MSGGAEPSTGPPIRRRATLGGLALLPLAARLAAADEVVFFRIATGGAAGTYYAIGGMIAAVIANPPGARPCDAGGSCGVPGLIALAQTSEGSVANVGLILSEQTDSGFVQSDVADAAFRATGSFAGKPPASTLRALASLYPESVQLVARADSGIGSIADLRGKRVALDNEGSGTLVEARLVLAAFGLAETDIQPFYIKAEAALAKMRAGEIDAFFVVAGYPTPSVTEATRDLGATLVPITGPAAEALVQARPFLTYDLVPFRTYPGVAAVETVSVMALWLVSSDLADDLAHAIVAALWNPAARQVLDTGHPIGRSITLETALAGIPIPLHPGAERYYREAGVLR